MANTNSVSEGTLQPVNECSQTFQLFSKHMHHIYVAVSQLELTNVFPLLLSCYNASCLILYIHNRNADGLCCLQFHGWSVSGLTLCVGTDIIYTDYISMGVMLSVILWLGYCDCHIAICFVLRCIDAREHSYTVRYGLRWDW